MDPETLLCGFLTSRLRTPGRDRQLSYDRGPRLVSRKKPCRTDIHIQLDSLPVLAEGRVPVFISYKLKGINLIAQYVFRISIAVGLRPPGKLTTQVCLWFPP